LIKVARAHEFALLAFVDLSKVVGCVRAGEGHNYSSEVNLDQTQVLLLFSHGGCVAVALVTHSFTGYIPIKSVLFLIGPSHRITVAECE